MTLLTSYQKDPDAGYRNFLPRYGTVETRRRQLVLPRDFNAAIPATISRGGNKR